MKTIITKSGQKFILLQKDYLSVLKQNEPLPEFFTKTAKMHLANCGYIICFPDKNTFFDIYEPVDNEYQLEEVYTEIENNSISIIEENILFKKHLHELFESAEIDTLDDDTKAALDQQIIEVANDNAYILRTNYYGRQERTYMHNDEWYKSSEKMQEYKEKGSNPERIANACKDFKKVCCRLLWSMQNWTEAVNAFKERAKEMYFESNKNYILKLGEQHKKDRIAKEEADKKFEEDVKNADSSKYAPTARDWQKMIDYRNRKSDPIRLAQSCKDNNKIIARAIIAKALGWDEAAKAFKDRALDLNILTSAELEAYARKYATYNIPQEYQDLIDAIKITDTKGGLSRANLDNSEKNIENELPKKLIKWLDENYDIKDYTITKSEKRDAIKNTIKSYEHAYIYTIHIIKFDETELDATFVMWNNGYSMNTNLQGRYVYTYTLEEYLNEIQHLINRS